VKICLDLDEASFGILKSTLTLIRPSDKLVMEIDEDYGLKQYSESKVEVIEILGNHATILKNLKLIELLNC
jgi:hypothetical protein